MSVASAVPPLSDYTCDTIGSPVQHQQVVTVSVIIHTDEDNTVVSIPPFIPLFHKVDDDGKPVTTDGIAHVYLGANLTSTDDLTERFVGYSVDAFTAQHSRGHRYNRISVAISGLINFAAPQAKILPVGFGTAIQFDGSTMKYETDGWNKTARNCQFPVSTSDEPKLGLFMGRISDAFDGGVALLKAQPQNAEFADTAGKLGGGPPAAVPVRSASLVPRATSDASTVLQPSVPSLPKQIFAHPDQSESDEETSGIKRARKPSKGKPKKKRAE